jgi:hypothetical protein
MQLQDWLTMKGLSNPQFGKAISRTAEAVRRYASGERIPDRDTMTAIVRETDGAVMPNDFYGVDHDEAGSAEVELSSPGKNNDLAAAQQSEAA